jgi:hypothetical protein
MQSRCHIRLVQKIRLPVCNYGQTPPTLDMLIVTKTRYL